MTSVGGKSNSLWNSFCHSYLDQNFYTIYLVQLSLSITTCINFVTARWNFHFHSPPGFVLLRAMSNFHFHSLPGFVQIFTSVSRVFHLQCLADFHQCLPNVSPLFQKCFKSVSKVFQSCLFALKSFQLSEHKEGLL